MNPFTGPLLASIQDYQYHRAQKGALHAILRKITRVRYLLWSLITQADIGLEAQLGSGLQLPHPNGVVIHEQARIGTNCMIMQQVTIGMIGEGEVPTIGDDVYIGAGAKILGRVSVGNGARVGANAVVMTNVPANHTAVGVPARIIPGPGARMASKT